MLVKSHDTEKLLYRHHHLSPPECVVEHLLRTDAMIDLTRRRHQRALSGPSRIGTIAVHQRATVSDHWGHVVGAFMKSNLAGIFGIMSPNRHLRPVEVDPQLCDAIIHWHGEHSPDGPDTAAIKLPRDITEQIAQHRIVCNLDHWAAIKDQIEPMEDIIMTGFPAAKMRNVSIEEWQRRDMMTLRVTAGKRLPAELDRDGFDRYEFKAIYVTEPPPESFEGVSGVDCGR